MKVAKLEILYYNTPNINKDFTDFTKYNRVLLYFTYALPHILFLFMITNKHGTLRIFKCILLL